jgi:hypothetical protein
MVWSLRAKRTKRTHENAIRCGLSPVHPRIAYLKARHVEVVPMGQLLDELPRRRFEASCRQPITSIHFEERARRYRLAAALAERRRDRETFSDWAVMFEKIAFDLRRLEAHNLERRITMKDGAIEIPTRPRKHPW